MHGIALVLLALALDANPRELPRDVYEIQSKHFAMPLCVPASRKDDIDKIRLFVSRDQGNTWTYKKDVKPSDRRVPFHAPQDGLYWFAIQLDLKDGSREPEDSADFVPAMKVYVNSERRALKAAKSYEELQREVEQLQKTVKELQKKIKQLETERKPG